MHGFIFAIIAASLVVVSANRDLMEAVASKNLPLVESLLKTKDVDVNYIVLIPSPEEPDGIRISNPLFRALEFDPFDEVAEGITMAIIKAGANLENTYIDGGTSLHMACARGYIDVVKALLERKADIEAVHPDYGTPLNIAVGNCHTKLALLLIKDYEPDLEAKTPISCRTPLQQACYCEDVAVVKALLNKNVKLDNFDKYEDTAVNIATAQGNVEIMKILKEKGATLNFGACIIPPLIAAVDSMNKGMNPAKYFEVAKILIESFDANIDATNKKGYTALHFATMYGNWKMVVFLIDKGAKQHLENENGDSSNDLAIKIWKNDLKTLYQRHKNTK